MSTAGRTETAKQPSSIERIQRLERLERERLEEKDRKEERRRQIIAGAKPSGGRNDLVDDIERVTKYPLALLGIAWLVIAIIIGTTDVTGAAPAVLVAILFALWVLLLAEYAVRLVISPDRRGYLRRRWVEPATVIVPPLQGWHLIGIEKTSLLAREGTLRVEAVLKHHSLFRVAIVTVTTVGYGDRYPTTEGGRAVAVVLMLVGIGLIGVLTATVASVFVKEHTDANRQEYQRGHADLGQRLSVISERLGDVERRLGASPADIAAVDAAADAQVAADGPVGPDPGASGP